jgi:hypothetical protein
LGYVWIDCAGGILQAMKHNGLSTLQANSISRYVQRQRFSMLSPLTQIARCV